MKKKIFALLTALCMTAAVLPAVFADGEEEPEPTCTCATQCTAESKNEACPVCGVEGADLSQCTGIPPMTAGTQEQCSCVTLCTESNINSDCPVCSAEGVTACKGEPVVPVLFGAPKSTVNVTYLDEKGDKKEVGATQVTGDDTEWNAGWYVVQDTITIDNRVTVSGNVNLILEDGCNLTVNGGIEVTGTNSFTIYAQSTGSSMGTLNATGAKMCAGIGGGNRGDGGNITINGGKITATGGGPSQGETSELGGAGIGGGAGSGNGGEIIINGGVIKATGGAFGAGIGGGDGGSGGTIKISGGNITATGGYWGAGIGGGFAKDGGSFSADGNAVIFANGGSGASHIQDNDDTSGWSGVIFQGNEGAVYGNPAPTQDFTIPNGKTLTIDEGKTLTIQTDVTMTNEGSIHNNGAIHNNGTIDGDGTLYNNGTLTGRESVACTVVEPTQPQPPQPTDPTTPETTAPTDTDHTVQTDNSGHAPVEDNTALPSFWDLVTERINATPRGGEITINMGARAVPDSVLNALRARSLTATFRYGDTELTLTPDQLPPEGMLTEWTLHELGNYVTEADESIRISEEKSEAENQATATETTTPAADTGKPNPATGETTTTAVALLVAVVALTGLGVTLKRE